MAVVPSSVVTRVVDYEPPLKAEKAKNAEKATTAPAASELSAAVLRTRHLHAVPPRDQPSVARRAAAAFADAAMRSVLEVIDQRRPGTQLRPLLAGGLVDTVQALSRLQVEGRAHPHTAAVLRRVRLQAVDPHETAFEVAASYTRGPRLHALACRVELVPTLRGARWQVVALHIG
jgi:Family of unknown function (DUF6459)